jgi:hypothetical protein
MFISASHVEMHRKPVNGFDKQDVLTMEVTLPAARYSPERRVQYYQQAVNALNDVAINAELSQVSLALTGNGTPSLA